MTKKTMKRKCKYCNRCFTVSLKHRVYCSKKCNKKGQLILQHQWYLNHRKEVLQRQKNNPNKAKVQRKAVLKKKYNLTPEKYNEILKKQNGVCAICKKPSKKQLAVDHDHKTGKVRGLLCYKCNTALGLLCHNRKFLQRAIKYLKIK